MVELGTKLMYNPIVFQEGKLLSKCVYKLWTVTKNGRRTLIIGCPHFANLCSGNMILVQYDQIKKIGWESKPHKKYVLQKLKLQQMAIRLCQVTCHITEAYLLSLYMLKQWQTCIALFYFNMLTISADPDSLCFQIVSSSEVVLTTAGCTYDFLFKDHYPIFSTSYCNKT